MLILIKMNPIQSGDIFPTCKVIDENAEYYFLKNMDAKVYWYDIVMSKKFFKEPLKIRDKVSVRVDRINIAYDSTPGVFVKLVSKL